MLSLLIQEFVTFFIILYISLMFLPCINKSDDDGYGKKTSSAQGIKLRRGGGGVGGKESMIHVCRCSFQTPRA